MIKSNERGPLALKADDTLLSNLSLVDSARKAIEDEIAKHSHAIVELKSRLNTFAPIARLPPELLSEIFVVCAIQYFELQERDIYYYGAPHYYSWIKVSHVCRHWRTVALNAPRLWCRIALTSRSAVKELLTRSKKAGLSIRADFRHSYSPLDERCKLLELAVEEIPRFKELSISCTARTLQGIFRMLARPAPLLQKLKISDPGNADLYYSYLPMLFSSETPSLYHLELRKVPIRWSNLILHSPLRHLVIVGRRDASVKPGGLADVLTALDNLPMLETLELEDAISTLPTSTTELPAVDRVVSLPHLRSIRLAASSLDCAHILSHLSLPSTTILSIRSRGPVGGAHLSHCIAMHLGSGRLRSMFMSQSYGMEIVIVLKGWTEVAEGDKIPFGQVPLLTLEVQCASTPPQDSASTLCQNLPLADVKVVDMSVSAFVASPDWLSAFDKMHNVTVMEVRGELLRGLPEALCAVLPSDGHSSPRMVLPSLRVLKLDSARLTEGDGIDSADSLLHSLSDCFMLRFEYGMEIEELYLTDCTNTCEDDVEFLEEVVVDVFWDGYEFYEQDEEEEEENYSDEDYYDDYDVNIYDLFDTDYDVFGY